MVVSGTDVPCSLFSEALYMLCYLSKLHSFSPRSRCSQRQPSGFNFNYWLLPDSFQLNANDCAKGLLAPCAASYWTIPNNALMCDPYWTWPLKSRGYVSFILVNLPPSTELRTWQLLNNLVSIKLFLFACGAFSFGLKLCLESTRELL